MRSIKTEGAVAQRRRDCCGFAFEALGSLNRIALIVVELCDEALEGEPDSDEVGAAVGVGIVGLEAETRGDAGEFAGAVIDQEIELAVRVEKRCGQARAAGWVGGDCVEVVVAGEEGEAELDDIMQVHLQRLYGSEAPEDPQDDLPERVHGWENTLARWQVRSDGLRPPFFGANGLKSGAV